MKYAQNFLPYSSLTKPPPFGKIYSHGGNMKVILLDNIQGHGKKGDIVTVNDGYARNYLLPKKLAVEATKAVLNEIQQKVAKEQRLLKEERDAALLVAQQLKGTAVTVKMRCGEDGKMYGSVTNQDIQNGLKELGYDIDKKKITIRDTIKTLGVYDAEVKVYKDISAKIKINVVAL